MSRKKDVFFAAAIGWAASVIGAMAVMFLLGFSFGAMAWAFLEGWKVLQS